MARVIVEEASLYGFGETASAQMRRARGFVPANPALGELPDIAELRRQGRFGNSLGELFQARYRRRRGFVAALGELFEQRLNRERGFVAANDSSAINPFGASGRGVWTAAIFRGQPRNKANALGSLAHARNRDVRNKIFRHADVFPMPPLSSSPDPFLSAQATIAMGPRAGFVNVSGDTVVGLRSSDADASAAQVGSAANVAMRLGAARQARAAMRIAPAVMVTRRETPRVPQALRAERYARTRAGAFGRILDAMNAQIRLANRTAVQADAAAAKGDVGLSNALRVKAQRALNSAKILSTRAVTTKGAFVRGTLLGGGLDRLREALNRGDVVEAGKLAATLREFNTEKAGMTLSPSIVAHSIDTVGVPVSIAPHVLISSAPTLTAQATGLHGFNGSIEDAVRYAGRELETATAGAIKQVTPALQAQVCRAGRTAVKSLGARATVDATLRGVGLSALATHRARIEQGFEFGALDKQTQANLTMAAAAAGGQVVSNATEGACAVMPVKSPAESAAFQQAGLMSGSALPAALATLAALGGAAWYFTKGGGKKMAQKLTKAKRSRRARATSGLGWLYKK